MKVLLPEISRIQSGRRKVRKEIIRAGESMLMLSLPLLGFGESSSVISVRVVCYVASGWRAGDFNL